MSWIKTYSVKDNTIQETSKIGKNEKAFHTGWTKEYVLTEDSRLVTDYFHQEQSIMEVLR